MALSEYLRGVYKGQIINIMIATGEIKSADELNKNNKELQKVIAMRVLKYAGFSELVEDKIDKILKALEERKK